MGFVSMFMDASSELIHSLLPVFLVTALGASVATIGVLEGAAEATAAIMKVFSGTLSDQFRKRKFLVVLGYGLSAFTKPAFPLARTMGWVYAARITDRVGKGIRGAPRDALIADVTPPALRGAAYGLRQALDTVGAFAGPALAILFMMVFANDIRAVMWIAVVPAFLCVLLLVVAVREPETSEDAQRQKNRFSLAGAGHLGVRFWLVVAIAVISTLARFSEAFLILRARSVGLAMAFVPAIMIVMNVVYAGFAYPAGLAADRMPARRLLIYGMGVLVVADAVLALATSSAAVFVGAAIWGLHMALTQGLLSKLVADAAPSGYRGTAFGVFNLAIGVALLLASAIAGALWSHLGASATFVAGAVFAALTVVGLLLHGPALRNAPVAP